MERVKFYSVHDIMCGHNLRNSEHLLREYQAGREINDINDIIEIYNVKKYFENRIYLSDWSQEMIICYENLIKSYFRKVATFFKLINDDTIVNYYDTVDRSYKDDFWELVEKFKVYENISEVAFGKFIQYKHVWLYEILKHKSITKYFGESIRSYMLQNSSSAKLLLEEYEMKHIDLKKPLYFPNELSNADKEIIIKDYLESETPNLNYVQLIANVQSCKDKLELSPKTKLLAKKKVVELENKFFTKESGMRMETIVAFNDTQDEEVLCNIDNGSVSLSYSRKWIKDNLDPATILNNFIYLFEYVDSHMRSLLVNKSNEMGVFERFLVTSSKHSYNKGVAFEQMNALSLLQMMGYYNVLFSHGIRLEEVIEWFYNKYLPQEFNAQNFKVTMPSINSTILEKCTAIMPALESVLKQFTLFVEEGDIDFELLEIRSEQLVYKNIPSLLKEKYVYGVGKEFKNVTYLLFSDHKWFGISSKF